MHKEQSQHGSGQQIMLTHREVLSLLGQETAQEKCGDLEGEVENLPYGEDVRTGQQTYPYHKTSGPLLW